LTHRIYCKFRSNDILQPSLNTRRTLAYGTSHMRRCHVINGLDLKMLLPWEVSLLLVTVAVVLPILRSAAYFTSTYLLTLSTHRAVQTTPVHLVPTIVEYRTSILYFIGRMILIKLKSGYPHKPSQHRDHTHNSHYTYYHHHISYMHVDLCILTAEVQFAPFCTSMSLSA
jgi:hypothetical protein